MDERMKVVRYSIPTEEEFNGRPKKSTNLARSGMLGFGIQEIKPDGGETNLHAHAGEDAFWFVLEGRARFYDAEENSVELGQHDGLFIPGDVPYWFDVEGDQPLRIIRSSARPEGSKAGRVNHEPLKEWQGHLAAQST